MNRPVDARALNLGAVTLRDYPDHLLGKARVVRLNRARVTVLLLGYGIAFFSKSREYNFSCCSFRASTGSGKARSSRS